MTQLTIYKGASPFLKNVQEWLEENEALNSLLLGLAQDNAKKENDSSFYLTLSTDHQLQFSGLQTPERNLIVYADHSNLENTLSVLADYLGKEKLTFPGMTGPKDLVLRAGEIFKNKLGWDDELVHQHLVYQLEQVKHNPPISGDLRLATAADLDLVAEWMHLFLIEALQEDDKEAARENAAKKINNKEVYLWVHNAVVSMTSIARPTNNGITINYVYTPLAQRKKGYGTKIVAELSGLMLKRGYRFCTLFTDVENPTSNHIYQKIGYDIIGEFRSIAFT